jgi:hypothetical protein
VFIRAAQTDVFEESQSKGNGKVGKLHDFGVEVEVFVYVNYTINNCRRRLKAVQSSQGSLMSATGISLSFAFELKRLA